LDELTRRAILVLLMQSFNVREVLPNVACLEISVKAGDMLIGFLLLSVYI